MRAKIAVFLIYRNSETYDVQLPKGKYRINRLYLVLFVAVLHAGMLKRYVGDVV